MLNGQNYQMALKWRKVQIALLLLFFFFFLQKVNEPIPPYIPPQAFKILLPKWQRSTFIYLCSLEVAVPSRNSSRMDNYDPLFKREEGKGRQKKNSNKEMERMLFFF